MAITFPDVLNLRSYPTPVAWTDRDTLLYAVAVGFGVDPLAAADLPFVYEDGLRAAPTLATVLATDVALRDQIGLDRRLIVHGAHKVVWLRPVPPVGSGSIRSRVAAVFDKGADKGAIVITETELFEDGVAEPLAVVSMSRFARGDGGFGGPAGGGEAPHTIPDRPADISLDIATTPNQALLYRLCGDRNPLHADPAFAAKAGFDRPILHGLCSFGIACRAILLAAADGDPTRLRSQEARFSAPVFPGETITVDLWRDGEVVSFEARVKARSVKVMVNGKALLAAL